MQQDTPRVREHPIATPADGAWLTPGVRGIGLASFLADVGHEVPTALLPSLITTTLGASAAALGVIEGVSDALAGAARFGGGVLADDPGRRRATAVGGYTSTAVLAGLTGVAGTVWQVAILRAGAWAARGLRVPARNALLADLVPASAYGRAYGFERMMDNLGAIGGPLLALGLVTEVGVRSAILLSIVPGLLAALAILYAIRQVPVPKASVPRPLRIQVRPVLAGQLGRLLLATGAFEAGHVAATLLILRTSTVLAPSQGTDTASRTALALYVAYNIAATIASIPAGRSGDRWGAPRVLAVGVALFGMAYLGFAAGSTSIALLGLSFVAAGIGIGCVETAEHAAVATLAPPALRGSSFGLLASMQAFGNLAASAGAGLLWTFGSPQVAFLYLAIWMAVALLGIVGVAKSSTEASVG